MLYPSKLFVAALALLLAPVSLALADDKADEAVLSLATARAKAELAVGKAQATFDTNHNGWSQAAQAAESAYSKMSAVIQKANQKEAAKPEADRNAGFMDQCANRLQQVQQNWRDYSERERQPISVSYQEAANQIQALNQAFSSLTQLEGAWKAGKLDLAALQANYDAVARRAAELKEQGQKAIDDMVAKQKVWETNLEATVKEFGK